MSQHLTESQARKLLEIAKERPCRVYTFHKSTSSQNAQKAVLLEVINKEYAVIRLLNKNKEETVELSFLRFWKAGNSFDIQEAVDAEEIEFPEIQKEIIDENIENETRDTLEINSLEEFIIVSRLMKCVWGGEYKKWTSETNRASVFKQKDSAITIFNRISKSPMTKDAEIVLKTEGCFLIDGLNQKLIDNKENIDMGTNKNLTSINEFMGIDIDSILNDDQEALKKELENRKNLAQEIKDAKNILEEALVKFQESQNKIDRLLGRKNTIQNESSTLKNQRITVRPIIREILKVHPKLNNETILEKVQQTVPSVNKVTVMQALYSMRASSEINRDENKNWALTDVVCAD